MQKFQIGDTVKVLEVVADIDYRNIPVGTIGIIRAFYKHYPFPYVLAEFPNLGFKESELELVTTSLPSQPEVVTSNGETLSTNPDLDKRVSEIRDKLLRDIFE